jgi:hypothetical protein
VAVARSLVEVMNGKAKSYKARPDTVKEVNSDLQCLWILPK